MATSGRIESGSFSSGRGRFYFQWQLAGQSTSGNYSTVNWQWGLNISGGGSWGSNAIKSVSGYINGAQVFGANTWSSLSGNGDHQLLSGSANVGHDTSGPKTFGMSSTGWSYGDGNFSNSGSWELPAIARNVTIFYTSGDQTDESNPNIAYNNPAGHGVTAWLELPLLTGTTQYAVRSNYVSGADFSLTTGERNSIRSAMASTNSTTLRYVTYDTSTGAYSTDDRTITIINANPTFTTFTYRDRNSATVTLTGNNQYIVQGDLDAGVTNSVPAYVIDIADKAIANKGATMVSYTSSLGAGTAVTRAYGTGAVIFQNLGFDFSTDQMLSVTATDSRGNSTTVSKTVKFVPYRVPVITASAERQDGFGTTTTINIYATYSPIVVNGVAKNSINNATGVGYKFWAVGGTEPLSYTPVASTYSGGNVTITTPPVETLSQSSEYYIKVFISDARGSGTYTFTVGIGKAAFRIGTDGFVYNENKKILAVLDIHPIGSVVIRNVNTSPQSVYGGTWTATTTASASLFGETLYAFKRTA